jgi:hypothetical protein
MTIPLRWLGGVAIAAIMAITMSAVPAAASGQSTTSAVVVANPGPRHPADLDLVQIQMSATGGIPPYTWSASGNLFGLSINPNTGLISGIVHAGTYNVTATATDTVGNFGSTSFSFTVQRSCHTC